MSNVNDYKGLEKAINDFNEHSGSALLYVDVDRLH